MTTSDRRLDRDAARRARAVKRTQRWHERRKRNARVFGVEVDGGLVGLLPCFRLAKRTNEPIAARHNDSLVVNVHFAI